MNLATRKTEQQHALRRIGEAVLWMTLLLALPCFGQFGNSGSGQRSQNPALAKSPSDIDQQSPMGVGDPVFLERRMQQLNAAQHKAMLDDTDKLLKLVNELNTEINSANPSLLTPAQLRMVAEIEKLAHSVRDKMRMTVRTPDDEQRGILPSLPQRKF